MPVSRNRWMLGNAGVQYDKLCQEKNVFCLSSVPQNLNLLMDQIIFAEACFPR